MNLKIIGDGIREIWQDSRLEQKDFADRIGVHAQTIQRNMAGKGIKMQTIVNMCEEFKVSTLWLYKRIGPKYEKDIPLVREELAQYTSLAPINKDNDFIQVIGQLKEVFDSKDQIFITAIQTNLYSFSRAIRREQEVKELRFKNKELSDKIESLEKRLALLEKKLSSDIQGEDGDPPKEATGTGGM